MKTVFLDSSVIVAAFASKTGASALILGYSRQKKLNTIVSREVIEEARKNISLKIGKIGEKRLSNYIKFANIRLVVSPSTEQITECEQYIDKKDAPILAAAIESQADYIVSLDRKHFLQPEVIKNAKPKLIISPGDFVLKHLIKNKTFRKDRRPDDR